MDVESKAPDDYYLFVALMFAQPAIVVSTTYVSFASSISSNNILQMLD